MPRNQEVEAGVAPLTVTHNDLLEDFVSHPCNSELSRVAGTG